jgi:hypothetical protein
MYLQISFISSCGFIILFLINKCLNTGFNSKNIQSKEFTVICELFSSISSLNKCISYTNYIDQRLQAKVLYFAENSHEWEKIPENRISNLIHSYTRFKKTCPKGKYFIPSSGYYQISLDMCENCIYIIRDGIKNKNIRDYIMRNVDSLKNNIGWRKDFSYN